jgi:hypothetical protein
MDTGHHPRCVILTATTATNCNNADFEHVVIFLLQLLQLQLKKLEEDLLTFEPYFQLRCKSDVSPT